jgi:hypothetical protein
MAAAILGLAFGGVNVMAQVSVMQPSSQGQSSQSLQQSISVSGILQGALDTVQQSVEIARPERWKAPAAVTAESVQDVASIQRDLNTTLPPLLASTNDASGSVAQLLPAYRNVEALYDVLVRVTQTAVLSAPAQQSSALQQATATLQRARRNFADLLDSAAQGQDGRLRDVQSRLAAMQSAPPVAAPAPACPPAPAVKKARRKAKASASSK